jgi:hypothetical protein
MCDSLAEGGRRCAAHTRPPFQTALNRVYNASENDKGEARAAGVVAVSAHASTRTGAQEVDALIEHAVNDRRHDHAAWLTTCRRLGDSQREAAEEIRRAIQSQRSQASLGPVLPGDVLNVSEGHIDMVTHIRRGSYVRAIRENPDGTAEVEVLAFRPDDVNRARRGPRDANAAYTASAGQVITVPLLNLRRPADNDDSANYYRAHTVEWEGDYYTEEVANEIIRAEPDSDFHERAYFAPREVPTAERHADTTQD